MEINQHLILETFFAETDEGLAAMEQAALEMQSRPDAPEPLRTLLRGAHTLKGNALSLGFPDIAAIASALEKRFTAQRDGKAPPAPELVTLFLDSIELLRGMVDDARNGADSPMAGSAGSIAPREGS